MVGVRFSLRSLLVVTALVAVMLGLGRMLWMAVATLGPGELSLLGWLGGAGLLTLAVSLVWILARQ